MDCLAIDVELLDRVAVVRAKKLKRLAEKYWPTKKRRKPRFCVSSTVMLCPRQRAKKYKT